MRYDYPALVDYVKDNPAIVALFSKIFETIATTSTAIFADYDSELFAELGEEYYYERSTKPLKVLYFKKCDLLDWSDSAAVTALMNHIGKVAYSRFGENWEDIYKAYFLSPYNPLENYSMLETRTPLLDTTTKAKRKQDTKTETKGSTSIVPFNDDEPTQTGESSGESTVTEDNTKNEIETKTEQRGTDTLSRSGNIGVTTSQQMLDSELALRKFDFVKRVKSDLDRILFRDYFGGGVPWVL